VDGDAKVVRTGGEGSSSAREKVRETGREIEIGLAERAKSTTPARSLGHERYAAPQVRTCALRRTEKKVPKRGSLRMLAGREN